MLPKISVVVPIYNQELYMEECVSSIKNQTLKDIEIICINDGSTDHSLEILKRLAENDHRIIVIDSINEGAALARNKGILKATGDYIAFMDPDDKYPADDVLEKMYGGIKKSGLLICGGSLNQIVNGQVINDPSKFDPEYTFHQEGVVSYQDYQYDYGYWRFLYNREFLLHNNILFPDFRRQQDPVFFIKVMSLAGEFYALDIPTYLYRVSHKRITWDERKATDLFKGLRECLTLSKEYGLYELHKKICYRLNAWTFRTALCETIKYPVVREKCIAVLNAIDTDIAGKDFLETLDTSYKAICKYKETGVLVSVIVPVYNVEEELRRCLDSVLVQSLDCIEIICVNDGSTDSSGEILDRYARVDNRIVIINKENGGLSSARNAALPYVKGSYIYFLDSDDWIESDTLEQLVMHMTGNVDVVVAGAIIEDEGGADADRLNSLKNYHSAKISGEFTIDDSLIDKITVTAWGKLFKNSIIQETGLTFLDGRKYEDNHFTIEYLIHAKNCFFVKKEFYHYVQRANSIMNSTDNDDYKDFLYIFNHLYKRLNRFGLLRKHTQIITKRYATHLQLAYQRAPLCEDENLKVIATQLAQNYNEEFFNSDLVRHIKNGEYGLVPLFDKDVTVILKASYESIQQAFRVIEDLLSQTYKTPRIELLIDGDYSIEALTKTLLPKELKSCLGEKLIISSVEDVYLEDIFKANHDSIILAVGLNASYQKNWLRYLMSAYLYHRDALAVVKYNSLAELNDEVLFNGFTIINFESEDGIQFIKSKQIIVSLTSYPDRIKMVGQAIQTIYDQTLSPDKVILWLALSQFPHTYEDLPEELLTLVKEKNLEIQWCEDLKPHKKYFYAFQQYPDALIVTIDDDAYYHNHLIENLYNSYLLHPNAVSAARAHLMAVTDSGKLLPYKCWPMAIDAFLLQPSMQLCAVGVGGVLYPTILFSKLTKLFDKEAIIKTCLYADDLWLKAMELIDDIPVAVAEEYKGLNLISNSQDNALWHENLENGENDRQLVLVRDEIDRCYGKNTFITKLMNTSVGLNLIGESAFLDLVTIYKDRSIKRVDQIKRQYAKYSTLRVDISIKGNKGAYVEEKSVKPNPLSLTKNPAWLPGGIVISSNAGTMKTVIQCHGDGELIIGILGIDIRNKHGQRYPIWIDCSRFAVNDEIIFDEVKTVCHDKSFIHKRVVKNGDILVLDFSWSECQSPSLLSEYKTLQTKVKNANAKATATETALKKQLAKVQKDNTIFKSQKESLENSYSFKIGRAITYVPRKIRGGLRCYQDHGISYTIKRTIEHFGIDMGTGDFKKNK